jgi:hypothetical protein
MLPTSRNTNYSPTSPILSVDLDAIQDCIIGAKHGPLEMMIPAAAFVAAGQSAIATPQNVNIGGEAGGVWRNWAAAPNNKIVSWIPIPVGSRVTAIDYYFNKLGSAASMQMNFMCTTLSVVGVPLLAIRTYNDLTSLSVEVTHSETAINYTIVNTDRPFIEVISTTAAHQFYGAKVTYDRL